MMKVFREEMSKYTPQSVPLLSILKAVRVVLEALQDEDAPPKLDDGICLQVEMRVRYLTNCIVDFTHASSESAFAGELDAYEFYSGNPCYPVTPPTTPESMTPPERLEYANTKYWCGGRWVGEYGDRRRALAKYFADEIQAWIKELAEEEAEFNHAVAAMPG